MPETVAIVDYGLGNLYSVSMACLQAGLQPVITAEAHALLQANAVILPGVGAFGDAMEALRQRDLVGVLRDIAAQGKPLFGICLGLQLLMTESEEFGRHRGLDLVPGRVRSLGEPREGERRLKVPQVGWNRIHTARPWAGSMLEKVRNESYMYFVHSYVVEPADGGHTLSTSRYGDVEFCSSLQVGNIFGCQFHPERSSHTGLSIYRNLRAHIGARVGQGVAHT